jgi:hypothetical protein
LAWQDRARSVDVVLCPLTTSLYAAVVTELQMHFITSRSVYPSITLHLITRGVKNGLRYQGKSVLAAHELYRNIHSESAICLKIVQPILRVGVAFRKHSEVCSQNQTSGLITLPLFLCLSAASYSQTRQQGITLFSSHNTARWRLSHEGARILMRQRQWHTAA